LLAPAPDTVKRSVDHFDQDRNVFLSGEYKEEQLRAAFVKGPSLAIRHSDFVIRTFYDPFFPALGWDMDSKAGLSETFKPVIHEEVINTCPERSGVPDYPSVDFGALWRYISLNYEENYGHSCSPR
jgi:hypothetical protein